MISTAVDYYVTWFEKNRANHRAHGEKGQERALELKLQVKAATTLQAILNCLHDLFNNRFYARNGERLAGGLSGSATKTQDHSFISHFLHALSDHQDAVAILNNANRKNKENNSLIVESDTIYTAKKGTGSDARKAHDTLVESRKAACRFFASINKIDVQAPRYHQ